MTMRTTDTILMLALLTPALLPAQRAVREFPMTSEREMVVIVDISFGTLILERGPRGMAAVVEYDDEKDAHDQIAVSYDVDDGRAKLRVRSKERSDVFKDKNEHDFEKRRVRIQCTEDVPIMFELELGAGRGELDLTGLQVQEFRISTGASKVRMWTNQPNPISADVVEIESGVSKFNAEGLSNLNFRRLKFDGGVGSYSLDFSGRLLRDCEVDIDVGLGAIVVDLPLDVDARLNYEDNWFSQFNLIGDFHERTDGVFETADFGKGRHSITVTIDSGLGSVKVRRR